MKDAATEAEHLASSGQLPSPSSSSAQAEGKGGSPGEKLPYLPALPPTFLDKKPLSTTLSAAQTPTRIIQHPWGSVTHFGKDWPRFIEISR